MRMHWQDAADESIELWTCNDDPETLTHESIGEAIAEWVEREFTRDCDEAAVARATCAKGVEVYGYRRRDHEAWLKGEAQNLAERVDEAWVEDEFGDPYNGLNNETLEKLAAAFEKVLRETLPPPWQCEHEVTVVVPLDDALALLRESCPEWFEVKHG